MLSHVFTSSIHLNVTLFQEKSVLIPTIHQAYEGYNHYRIRKHSPDPLVHHFDQGVWNAITSPSCENNLYMFSFIISLKLRTQYYQVEHIC